MDSFLVRRFARRARPRCLGSTVRRVVPVHDGLLLVLRGEDADCELGFALGAGAAWAWCLGPDDPTALRAEIGAARPDLLATVPELAWREPRASALDALRAWILRPAPASGGWSRLEGARVIALEPRGRDRVLAIGLETQDALGRTARLVLLAELFDRGGNLVLHDAEGAELWNWRGRPLAPERGVAATEPTVDLPAVLAAPAPERALLASLPELGRGEARRAIASAGGDPEALGRWLERRAARGDDVPLAWHPSQGLEVDLDAAGAGLSLTAAAYLQLSSCAASELGRAHAGALRRDAARVARRLEKLDAEAKGAGEAERWRAQGELLAANLHRVRRGQSRITVEDLFAGNASLDIELDPRLSPQENVARLFRRARRAARGREVIAARRESTRAELESLRTALSCAEEATDWSAVVRVASPQLQAAVPRAGVTPPAQLWSPGGPQWQRPGGTSVPGPEPAAGPGRRILLAGEWEVRVGRSNAENDELTHRFARPDDVWLHASGVPGSHVVLRMRGRTDNPPREVLEVAAAIAARFSKAKHSGTVPVVWTRRRFVRKPRGAKPGLAVCTHEKTLFVRPGLPGDAADD